MEKAEPRSSKTELSKGVALVWHRSVRPHRAAFSARSSSSSRRCVTASTQKLDRKDSSQQMIKILNKNCRILHQIKFVYLIMINTYNLLSFKLKIKWGEFYLYLPLQIPTKWCSHFSTRSVKQLIFLADTSLYHWSAPNSMCVQLIYKNIALFIKQIEMINLTIWYYATL